MTSEEELKRIKIEKIQILERRKALAEVLPHLYGRPWYKWAYEFFESKNKLNFLCAANQISKSSTQIRKAIHWATEPTLWTQLWQTPPVQFWYLYPSKDVATIEWETKWVPEFMPRGLMKDDPKYGWDEVRDKEGYIYAVYFRSGVRLYFKTYGQSKKNIQTGTVHTIFADEELPADFFDELMFRLAATGGFFHMVFTATIGQQLWWDVIEGKGEDEKFPEAAKWQVSMFDCLTYMDGTPSPWTEERIHQIISSCKNQNEIDRRVHGKFVKNEGLVYPTFNHKAHVKEYHPVPQNWRIYPGIDAGGGGEGHPGAIVFVAVAPDYKSGRVYMSWRGDGIDTTAADIVNKYVEMGGQKDTMPAKYDFAAKDLATVASRMGLSFSKAEKSHEIGEQILNTLFKYNMLFIYNSPENQKLVTELLQLRHSTSKRKAKDDLCDALRYACAEIPWDWSSLSINAPQIEIKKAKTDVDLRREAFLSEETELKRLEEEFDAWNEMYGTE